MLLVTVCLESAFVIYHFDRCFLILQFIRRRCVCFLLYKRFKKTKKKNKCKKTYKYRPDLGPGTCHRTLTVEKQQGLHTKYSGSDAG